MKNFNEIYEKIYKENFTLIEQKRKVTRNRKIFISLIIFLIGLIIFINQGNKLYLLIGLAASVLSFNLFGKNGEYNISYKQLIIGNLIKGIDSNLEYSHQKGIDYRVYTMAEFEKFDRYRSEDGICGTLNNKNILMAEVKTEKEEHDEEGKTHYVPIFRGLFARIDFDQTIDSTTRIRKNKRKFIDTQSSLEMDSGEFEKIYDVYSDGKIETMQILTLDIMQKFIDFKQQTGFIPELTIKENSMYIRFTPCELSTFENGADVFEADVLKNALDYKKLKQYYDIFNFIETITDAILENIEG